MNHFERLQVNYVDNVWKEDADFDRAFLELEEQIKSTRHVGKKRNFFFQHFAYLKFFIQTTTKTSRVDGTINLWI